MPGAIAVRLDPELDFYRLSAPLAAAPQQWSMSADVKIRVPLLIELTPTPVRYLSRTEQQILRKALLRSVTVIDAGAP
jgi:hypothetical protein